MPDYGPARARQLRLFLWLTLAAGLLTVLVAASVLAQGGVRFGLFLLVPAVGVAAAASVALRRLGADRPARVPAAAAGALTLLLGLVTAALALGFIAILLGLLTTMLALLPEAEERD